MPFKKTGAPEKAVVQVSKPKRQDAEKDEEKSESKKKESKK